MVIGWGIVFEFNFRPDIPRRFLIKGFQIVPIALLPAVDIAFIQPNVLNHEIRIMRIGYLAYIIDIKNLLADKHPVN
jgi:hypothetical protein